MCGIKIVQESKKKGNFSSVVENNKRIKKLDSKKDL